MSTNRILATIKDMIDFNDLYMNNIPNKEETQTRTEKLRDIRNCLIKQNVTRDTFVELNRQNSHLQEKFPNYDRRYDKFIIEMKHLILIVRVQIILLELS